ERLACPHVELVPFQPSLHERGLEDADHLLAVGVRGPQITAACGCWRLIWRLCHHLHLPRARCTERVAPLPLSRPSSGLLDLQYGQIRQCSLTTPDDVAVNVTGRLGTCPGRTPWHVIGLRR